ncbi:hypothetical protein QOT17_005172 [Balamuthia mandrillaris]
MSAFLSLQFRALGRAESVEAPGSGAKEAREAASPEQALTIVPRLNFMEAMPLLLCFPAAYVCRVETETEAE